MGKISAGIVLFNPEDEIRLYRSINSVLSQVERVYIFDNSTESHNYIFPDSVVFLTEHENKGVSYALNKLMLRAKNDGFDWLITMDQDSILPEQTIVSYEAHISDDPLLAIICPQVIDTRRSYMEIKKEPAEEYVDFCITSASCTNLNAWKNVGGFDEWLFIDLVDNDFCKRIIVSGYKILRINSLVLDQEFGKIIPKNEKVQSFWNNFAKKVHNMNFAKLGYKKLVSPTRVYYTNRNIIYINRKLKKYGKTGYKQNYNCNTYFGFLISFSIPSILRAQNKIKVLKAVIKGIKDGAKMHPADWHPLCKGTD